MTSIKNTRILNNINCDELVLDTNNDAKNLHFNIRTTGAVGENDIEFKTCNVKVSDGDFHADVIKDLDGNEFVNLSGANHVIKDTAGDPIMTIGDSEINFHSATVNNLTLGSLSLDTSDVTSLNYVGQNLDYELDTIATNVTGKLAKDGQTASKILTTSAGGVIQFVNNSSLLTDIGTNQTNISTNSTNIGTIGSLNTTATDLVGAVNEIHGEVDTLDGEVVKLTGNQTMTSGTKTIETCILGKDTAIGGNVQILSKGFGNTSFGVQDSIMASGVPTSGLLACMVLTGSSGSFPQISFETPNTSECLIRMVSNGGDGNAECFDIKLDDTGTNSAQVNIGKRGYGGSDNLNMIHLDLENGRVGINQSSATVPLDVNGDTKVNGDLEVTTDTTLQAWASAGTRFRNYSGGASYYANILYGGTSNITLTLPTSTGTLALQSAVTEAQNTANANEDAIDLLDDNKLNLTGGTLTGVLNGTSLVMNGGQFSTVYMGSSATYNFQINDAPIGGSTETFAINFNTAFTPDAYFVGTTTATDVRIGTNNGTRLQIDSGGDITTYNQVTIEGATYRDFSSSDTDITGNLPSSSSAFGHIIEGKASGHLVLGIRGNDSKDTVSIMSYTSGSSYDTPVAVFQADGKVGIGFSDPLYPLHIGKGVNVDRTIFNTAANNIQFEESGNALQTGEDNYGYYLSYDSFYYGGDSDSDDNFGGNFNTGGGRYTVKWLQTTHADYTDHHYTYIPISIRSHGSIWGLNYYASSDHRIKKNILFDLSGSNLMDTFRALDVCMYEYRDKYSSGGYSLGFIAQQVKEHYPSAVDCSNIEFIPDSMKIITGTWENTFFRCVDTDLDDGVAYKLYVGDVSGGEVEKELRYSNGGFQFDASYNKVFLYGRLVDDFHSLNKPKLFTLNYYATQELDKEVQMLKNKVAVLESKLAQEEVKTAYFQMRIDNLYSHLNL